MSKWNGFLLLDKPPGLSSNQALYPVKKLLPKGTKIGHTGTLDPGATGLLVLALGRATRFISYLKSNQKSYEASLRFGIKTDSADIWGNILEERQPRRLTIEEVLKVLSRFQGEIEQIPPMYSALKKDGRPLYELARKGICIDRESRRQFIYSLELLSLENTEASIRVVCDVGTYIRTLIEDIAAGLGELAAMTALRRLTSDGFSLDRALAIQNLTSLDVVEDGLISINEAFSNLASIELDYGLIKDLRNGKKPNLCSYLQPHTDEALLRLMHANRLYALVEPYHEAGGFKKILWTEEGLYA